MSELQLLQRETDWSLSSASHWLAQKLAGMWQYGDGDNWLKSWYAITVRRNGHIHSMAPAYRNQMTKAQQTDLQGQLWKYRTSTDLDNCLISTQT